MKLKLNAKLLENLQTMSGKRQDYFDSGCPGLLIRVSPKNDMGRTHKSFIVIYQHKGRQRRLTLGSSPPLSLKDGRDLACQALRDAALGCDPASAKTAARRAETFAQLASEYLERYSRPRKKSWREDERLIDKVLNPAFGSAKAIDVSRADVRRLVEKIAERAPISANRTLSALSKIFNWAIGQDLVQQNPCSMIAHPGVEHRRDRALSESEIKLVWDDLENEEFSTAAAVKLRLITAQRGGEVHAMRWEDIGGEWWTVPPESAKNKLPHRVPLTAPAAKLLRELRERQDRSKAKDSRWVFPARGGVGHLGSAHHALMRTRERTGIADFTLHDLRRTAVSCMTSMGVPRLVAGMILNHAEPGVTATYDRNSYDNEKRDALERWARKLGAIVSGLKAVEPISQQQA